MTTISSEIKHSRVGNSSLYRGSIGSGYIEGELSGLLGKKVPYTRM